MSASLVASFSVLCVAVQQLAFNPFPCFCSHHHDGVQDCFTIPAVMLLSWLVLHSRYRPGHFLGALLCVSGLAVLVLGDARSAGPAGAAAGTSGNTSLAALGGNGSWTAATQSGVGTWLTSEVMPPEGSVLANDSGQLQRAVLADAAVNSISISSSSASAGSAPLLGDVLVLLGALLYSVCNVTQELILGDVRPSELLAGIGVFGAMLSGLQAVLLGEWHSLLAAVNQSWLATAGPMLGFACAMLCFYSLVPHVLMLGGATVLNISLLSSDAWAALARFLWFGGFGGSSAYFFLGSLVMVASGIVVYALSGSPKVPMAGSEGGVDDSAAAGLSVDGAGAASAAAGLQGAGRATGSRQPSVGGYSRIMNEGDVEDQQAAPVKQ
jgi:drug/metabolite transporter (DMT)-like permease